MRGTGLRWPRPVSLALVSLLLVGCRVVQFPDPNEPAAVASRPEIALQNIREAYRILANRVYKRQITTAERDEKIKQLVDLYADAIKIDQVPPEKAWQFADLLRQAGRWEDAYKLLQTAVKVAPDDDRFVNDSLQLARVAAHLGKVDEAIAGCRSTFKVSETQKAPIMMSVLYEVVPEGLGKGKDMELAKLLEDSILQHEQTIVDPGTEAGKEFLASRPHHIKNAWSKVVQIYANADRKDLAREALGRMEKAGGQQAKV